MLTLIIENHSDTQIFLLSLVPYIHMYLSTTRPRQSELPVIPTGSSLWRLCKSVYRDCLSNLSYSVDILLIHLCNFLLYLIFCHFFQ